MISYTSYVDEPIDVYVDDYGDGSSYRTAVPLGIDGYYWAVRVLTPEYDGGTIGQMIIGQSIMTGLTWKYLTSYTVGLSYSRGGGAGDLFEAGELTIRLTGSNGLSPAWDDWYGPGAVIQVVVSQDPNVEVSPEVHSQFVGVVTNWVEVPGDVNFYDITAIEPFGLFAQIQTPAVAAQGLNETATARLITLWQASEYPFSYSVDMPASSYNCYSTTLADNRMAELRKLAQTFDAQIHSGKNGALRMIARAYRDVDYDNQWFNGDDPALILYDDTTDPWLIPCVRDSFTTANDDRLLISELTLQQASGNAYVTYEQSFGSRYQKRAVQILDLVFRDNYSDADLDWLADKILSRGDQTYRPASIDITSLHGEKALRYLLAADVGLFQRYIFGYGVGNFYDYSICRITNYVQPIGAEGLVWDATIEFDVEADSFVDT